MATPVQATENPYGLVSLWVQGDYVARGTMLLLVVMSALSWWVMITKVFDQRRIMKQAKQAERDFWQAGSIKQAIDTLKGKNNAFKAIAEEGLRAAQHHEGRLTDQIDLHEWISQSLQRALDQITNYLQGGLPILATVGSTAPFVGLFGTVWGILNALISIGVAGQASIDKRRRSGRRGAHHDGHRPGGRGAGGARLQHPAAAEQDRHREAQVLCDRPARLPVERRTHRRRIAQGACRGQRCDRQRRPAPNGIGGPEEHPESWQ